MPRVTRDPAEYEEELREQLGFLARSCEAFDAGHRGEFKRIALALRLLLHDTATSKSLLAQMGKQAGITLKDYSMPFDPANLAAHNGLIRMALFTGAPQRRPEALPMLDDSPVPPRDLSFEEWWTGIVFVDQARMQFSREDLVLTAANQDGGGHVDPSLDSAYERLTRRNSLGFFETVEGKETPSRNQVPVAIRHIGFELLMSLSNELATRPPDPPGAVIVAGIGLHEASSPPDWPRANQRKPGRNSLCPCGSGKKFKRCCG